MVTSKSRVVDDTHRGSTAGRGAPSTLGGFPRAPAYVSQLHSTGAGEAHGTQPGLGLNTHLAPGFVALDKSPNP